MIWIKIQMNAYCVARSIAMDVLAVLLIVCLPHYRPLRELSERLIQIHGQHEHQALLKTEIQRSMLDRYAGHQNWVDSVHALADEWQMIHREITQLRQALSERNSRSDFLKISTA